MLLYNLHLCSAGKCRIAGKRHNLRKMSHRRREMSQSAENVVNPTAGICRIVDGKCRKKIRCRYMSQHRREMSQLLLTTKLIEKCMHGRTLLTIYNNTRV